MSGQRFARFSDRAIAVSALIACLSLVSGLFDVPLRQLAAGPVAPPPPVEQHERDAELELTVTDASGQPISGATARAFWERAGKYYLAGTGQSAEDGRVILRALPRGVLWVLVEAPQHGRSSTQVLLSDAKQSAKLTLTAAHSLALTVLEDENGPIAGATVLVTGGDPLPFGALTDAQGTARLNRLGDPPWTVKASARGFESVTRSGITSDTTLTLRRLGSLEVRVEDPSGAPAPGAAVVIAGSSLWPARRAETDASGFSRISGLLSGTYELKATRGEQASDTLFGLVLERGGHEKVTLRLRPGRRISVLVTDGEDERARGVSDADVVLVESGLSSFPLRGRTGADGLVTLGPITPGPATVGARAAEFVPRGGIPVPEKVEGPVRVALRRGATLRGEVVDARDRPVDGASVEVIGTDLDGLPLAETPVLLSFRTTHFEWALPGPLPLIPAGELGVMPGPVPPIPAAWAPLSADPLGALGPSTGVEPDVAIEPWVTGLNGRFTARPVTPGRVRALVRHPAYVEGTSDVVTLAPGGEASVRVVLLAGGTLEGRVVDERGGRVSGARVDLVAERGTLERTTVTASDGSFAFAAVPAEIVLSVARPDEPATIVLREAISVGEGEKKVVELKLPALRESVRVLIKDDAGAPIEAAQVTLLSTDPKAPLRRTLFTGADGSVSIADARGLALRVLVEAPGWARAARASNAAPETLEIVLERGVSVAGRVTAVHGRRYVEGASVTLIAEGLRKSAITDKEGAFTVREISPGPARVLVSHPEFASVEQTVQVRATGRADRPFELEPVDLSEPGIVEGEVVDAHGKPVSGARVALGVAPAYLPVGALPPGMAVSDGSGRFRLNGVTPGNVELEAYAADIGRGSTKLVVMSGRPTGGVRIRLDQRADDAEPAASGSVAVTLGERSASGGIEIVIVNVAGSSEAERGGLREGDIIEFVDGVRPQNMRDARVRLSGAAGSDVVVGVRRGTEDPKLRVGREAVRR